MKKFLKALAALMASTMLFGAMFTSCSSGDDSGGDETPKITITANGSNSVEVGSTLKLTSDIEDVNWSVDKSDYATLSAAEDGTFAETATGTTVYLKGGADGSVVVTASKDGYESGTITVTVGTGGSGGDEDEDEDDGSYIFTTNDLGYSSTQADTSITESTQYLDGKVTVVAGESMAVDVKGFSTNTKFEVGGTEIADVYGYIRLNGRDECDSTKDWLTSTSTRRIIAFTVPKDASKIYILSKVAGSGTAKISVTYDKTNYILDEDAPASYDVKEIDVASLGLTEDTTFYLYNKNVTAGTTNAGLNFKGLYVQMAQSPLASIEITTQPTKTSYALNEELDTTGIVVKATYENGKTKTVTSKVTYSELVSTSAGEREITASYTEGDITRTATFKVTVTDKTLSSIAVNTEKSTSLKTEYSVGDSLDLTGLVITATYSDGSITDVTYSSENKDQFSASEFDSSEATESQTVTVTYAEKTATFTVKISNVAVTSVTISGDTTVMAGQTITLTAKVEPSNATDNTVTWTSSNPEVATVADGVVTGVAKGDVTITATAGGVSSEAHAVTVTETTYFSTFDLTKDIIVGTATSLKSTIDKTETSLSSGDTVTITENAKSTLKDSSAAFTLKDSDGTWEFSVPKSKSLEIKNGTAAWTSGSFTTYDNAYTYKNRIAFNSSGATLKLFTGTGEKKLRIDGGAVSGTKSSLTVTGSADSTSTWEPSYEGIYYVTVTADDSGYVTLTGSTSANMCIYGIYVVDSIPDSYDASAAGVSGGVTTYSTPEITLEGLTDGSISNAEGNAVTISASATKSVADILYDGTVGTATDSTLSISDMTVSIVETSESGTAPTYSDGSISVAGATDDTYTVTVALNDDSSKTASKEFTVTDANATYVTVTFNKNADDAAITTTTQKVKSGEATELTSASDLGLSYSGYTFSGWAESAEGEVKYTDKKEITITEATALYAVWAKATSVTYTMKASSQTNKTKTTDGSLTTLTTDVSSYTMTLGGTSYTIDDRINFGGGYNAKPASSKTYVSFTTTGAGSVTVKYYATAKNTGRYVVLYGTDSDATAEQSEIGSAASNPTTASTTSADTAASYTFSFTKAGTYYIMSGTSGIYVSEVSVTVQQ